LIGGQDTLKVGDFGLSEVYATNPSLRSSSGGTLRYAAPEILIPSGKRSRKTDVWALAIVAYELVFNATPYQAQSEQQFRTQVTSSGLDLKAETMHTLQNASAFGHARQQFPKAYFDLIAVCTSYDAKERYTAELMSDELASMPYEIKGGLASALCDGFNGDDGAVAVVSCIGEVDKWNLVNSTCKYKRMHFKGYWRPDVKDWLPPWQNGVVQLHKSGKASKMLVVTYDTERNGSLLGKNMRLHELPFLDKENIPTEQITFVQFMCKYGTWT